MDERRAVIWLTFNDYCYTCETAFSRETDKQHRKHSILSDNLRFKFFLHHPISWIRVKKYKWCLE